MSSSAPNPPEKVRWRAVAGVTIVGTVVTAIPFILTSANAAFGTWQATVAGTLTNAGTTILLVAAVWLLERGLTSRVTEAVERRTSEVVAAETAALRDANAGLALRLDELQERLEARVGEARRAEDATLDRLRDGVSRDSVTEAIEQADRLGALWLHRIIVPAGDGSPEQPRFEFRYGELEAPWSSQALFGSDDRGQHLTLACVDSTTAATGAAKVTWTPGQAGDEVLAALQQRMVERGQASLAKAVDASLFGNLEVALRCAVAGRRNDEGTWVKGAMHEWLRDGWAVTSAGLEARDHQTLPPDAFPRHMSGRPGVASNHEVLSWKPPTSPPDVSTDDWNFMLTRARVVHRMSMGF